MKKLKEKRGFGYGYSIVVHSFICYLFTCFWVTGIANVVFPALAESTGIQVPQLLKVNTIVGIIAAILSVLVGQIVLKKGPKIVTIAGYLVGGVVTMLLGHVTGMASVAVCLFLVQLSMLSYSFMTTNNLIANWFPKKKGVVLGITTMGLALGNSTLTPLFSKISAAAGFRGALLIYGIIMILLGLVSIFWLKERPQEVGLYPDNDPEYVSAGKPAEFVSKWTFAKLLRNKNAYLITFSFGLSFLACIGAVSQLVSFAQFRTFSLPQSLTIMSIGGIASAVISFVSGAVDQKWGTKKATILYCILCLISYLILVFVEVQPVVAVFLVFVVGLNGAPGNLTPSMFITKFGAQNYTAVNRILMPVVMVLRSCSYFVVGMAMSMRGNMADIYVVLAAIIVISFILLMFIDVKSVETVPE